MILKDHQGKVLFQQLFRNNVLEISYTIFESDVPYKPKRSEVIPLFKKGPLEEEKLSSREAITTYIKGF